VTQLAQQPTGRRVMRMSIGRGQHYRSQY
jgi:hypothetical protein